MFFSPSNSFHMLGGIHRYDRSHWPMAASACSVSQVGLIGLGEEVGRY